MRRNIFVTASQQLDIQGAELMDLLSGEKHVKTTTNTAESN